MYPRNMQNLLWHLVLLSSIGFGPFGSCAAVSNQPSVPISITQPQHLANSSLEEDTIPSTFTIDVEPTRGPELSDTFVFNGAIQLIGDHLALEDFNERIPAQAWLYHGIIFAVSTKLVSENDIERRFVLWGFSKAVRQMAFDKDFRTAVYVLKYKGNMVGSLALYPVGYPSLHGSFETADIAQLDAPISPVNSGTDSSVSIASGGTLELRITLVRPDMLLDRYGYLVNVMNVLVTAAEYPNNARVSAQFFSLPRFDVNIMVTDTLLTWKWPIKTMTMLPSAVERQGIRFAFKARAYLGSVFMGDVTIYPNVVVVASNSRSWFIEDGLDASGISATA